MINNRLVPFVKKRTANLLAGNQKVNASDAFMHKICGFNPATLLPVQWDDHLKFGRFTQAKIQYYVLLVHSVQNKHL